MGDFNSDHLKNEYYTVCGDRGKVGIKRVNIQSECIDRFDIFPGFVKSTTVT